MQYILTQEELDQLKAESANAIRKVTADLQTACTMIADRVPIKDPWGCILTQTAVDEWYCDHCPARKLCPHPNKNWSK